MTREKMVSPEWHYLKRWTMETPYCKPISIRISSVFSLRYSCLATS